MIVFIDSIIHLDKTVKNLAYAVSHYNETIDRITVTANEWAELRGYAMKHDPSLAGELLGYVKGSLTSTPTTDLVLGGVAVKVIQKIGKAIKVKINPIKYATERKITFGINPNQEHHTSRHVINELNLDFEKVKSKIINDIPAELPYGNNARFIEFDGVKLQYNVFKFEDGSLNVGRINGVK